MTDNPSPRRWRRRDAQAWRELLARQVQSGLAAAAFCAREGISQASLYRWRERLAAAVPTPPFVDLGALANAPPADAPRLELRLDLGGGLTLTLVRS